MEEDVRLADDGERRAERVDHLPNTDIGRWGDECSFIISFRVAQLHHIVDTNLLASQYNNLS